VFESLSKLEEVDTNCWIILAKELSSRFGIRMIGDHLDQDQNDRYGTAGFIAFDPADCCLRFPSWSFPFLDAAEKNGLISFSDKMLLTKALVEHGALIASQYSGYFSSFFQTPWIKGLFARGKELGHLALAGHDIGAAYADRLFRSCPWPILPQMHFKGKYFAQILADNEFAFYSADPWLAWTEALDAICAGPWVGLKTREIRLIVSALGSQITVPNVIQQIESLDLARKVVIPLYSNGFQGLVIGQFKGIKDQEKEFLLALLLEYGETMAGVHALSRLSALRDAFKANLSIEKLSDVILHAISPVSSVVIEKSNKRLGYKLRLEKAYWAGYENINDRMFSEIIANSDLRVELQNGVRLYISPIEGINGLNPSLMRVRLQGCFDTTLVNVSTSQPKQTITKPEIQEILSNLSAAIESNPQSIAKLRQYFVAERVERNWSRGFASVTNAELKNFLEDELGRPVPNGYQVTSFQTEIEKLFKGCVTTEKTRMALSLTWSVRDKG
jgi:hypothetical protein